MILPRLTTPPKPLKKQTDALKVGGGLVDAAADMVPPSVPRPVAKAGVALAGAGVAFWLLQKVVSTVITLAVIGGGLYFYLARSGGDGGERSSSSSSKGGGGGDDDDDDPLAEARRIMSKYTK
jgi:TATA-binding protein-associated factor